MLSEEVYCQTGSFSNIKSYVTNIKFEALFMKYISKNWSTRSLLCSSLVVCEVKLEDWKPPGAVGGESVM